MGELTQKYMKELFDYREGNLIWKVRKANIINIGDIAGYIKDNGYRYIRIDGKNYRAHRLIYLYHYGYLPNEIDHIDRNRSNNRIDNLRPATQSENKRNRGSYKNSSSCYKGVSWCKSLCKWQASIYVNGKAKHLGYFIYEKEAAHTYDKVAIEYYGEFVYLNFVGCYNDR
jgi:hypothetical protein